MYYVLYILCLNKYNQLNNNVYVNKSTDTTNRWIWNGQEVERPTITSSRPF